MLARTPDTGQFQAVRNKNPTAVRSWLSHGGDVNLRDSHGTTLPMQAAAFGSMESLDLLLKHHADVNARTRSMPRPCCGRYGPREGPPAHRAWRGPQGGIQTGPHPVDGSRHINDRDSRGGSALEAAAQTNDIETMRLLIEKGADAAGSNAARYTPLMASAASCNLPAVRLLLAKGADVNAANSGAGAVKFGPIQIIHMTPLMFAAPYCSLEIVKALLDAGARINDRDSRDMTPLMFAVTSEDQNPAVVKLLLASGADVNVRSTMGETALDWASKFGNREIIGTLTAAGARGGDPFTPPVRKAASARNAAQATEVAVGLLQRSGEFFKQSGCYGCHHQPIAAVAGAAARAAGLKVDTAADRQALEVIRTVELGGWESRLERAPAGGLTDPPAYALLSLSAAAVPADSSTDAVSVYLAGSQQREGAWRVWGSPRSPIQEGVTGRSVIAGRAIQMLRAVRAKGGI